MASFARMFALSVLFTSAFAGLETDGIPRAAGSSTKLLGLGASSKSKFVTGSASAAKIGTGVVQGAHFSFYSHPKWDAAYMGSSMYWMGLGYGGCGYGNLLSADKWPHLMAVALSKPTRDLLNIPSSTVGCGACVRITCPEGNAYCKPGSPSVIAVVTDICPDVGGHSSGNKCAEKHVDGYMKVYEEIASDSNPDVTIERVQCPAVGGNVKLYVMESWGPQQFLKINVQDVGGSGLVTAMSMQCEGSEAQMLELQYGAVFVANNQPKKVKSCKFAIVTDDGATITSVALDMSKTGKMDESEGISWLAVHDTGAQFGTSSSGRKLLQL